MAEPNISLLGATYSGVKGVTLPKSGGGTATFPWVEGSETKTANGTYDVTNLAELVVNVSGGGSGLAYETGTYSPSADIARPTISFTGTHSEAPIFVAMSDISSASGLTSNSNVTFTYYDPYKLFGSGFPTSTSATAYAIVEYTYRSNSYGGSRVTCTQNSDSTTDKTTAYPRYWAFPTGFKPYSNSTSRYWRIGRSYKWIAVWKTN